MTLIFALISAFLPLLSGLIGKSDTGLIQSAFTALTALIAAWTSNKTDDASAALTALQTVLTALKADTSLDPTALAQISECDGLATQAIAAVELVETQGFELSTYTPPPPVA
jgi:hypothetical protein